MAAVTLPGQWQRDQLRTESGASDPSYRKRVSAAQQKMTPHSGVYSKTFQKVFIGGFCQGVGRPCQAAALLISDDVLIKDRSLLPWMASFVREGDMHFAIRLPARLAAFFAKWSIIGLLWIASVVAVTTSAMLMDAISDSIWRLAGIATVDLTRKRDADKRLATEKKRTAKANQSLIQEKRANAKTKRKVAAHGRKVRGFGKKMVGRNLADATTSVIPVVGGVASVTFAVADVHAACELVTMQNELETALGIDSDPSTFETYCIESINQINQTASEAKTTLTDLAERLPDMPDMPDVSVPTEWWANLKCRASIDC